MLPKSGVVGLKIAVTRGMRSSACVFAVLVALSACELGDVSPRKRLPDGGLEPLSSDAGRSGGGGPGPVAQMPPPVGNAPTPVSFEDEKLPQRFPLSAEVNGQRVMVGAALGLAESIDGAPAHLVGLKSLERCDYYLSPSGSDTKDGLSPEDIGASGPFATLERARDALRALKAAGVEAKPRTVCLRAGTYFRSTPFVLTLEDSGTENAPITYRPYRQEKVVLSGAVPLTKPKVDAEGIWHFRHEFLEKNNTIFPEQAYVNGRLATRARSPNRGFFFATKRKPGPDEQSGLILSPENEDQFWGRKEDVGDLMVRADNPPVVNVMHSFSMSRAQVDRVDPSDGHLYLRAPLSIRVMLWNTFGQRYFIENTKEAFDAAGEWFFDVDTSEVLYRPLPFEKPDEVRVDVPINSQLLEVAGDWKKGDEQTPFFQRRRPIAFVNFEGLAFRNTAHFTRFGGDDGNQAAPTPQGAIVLEAAEDIRFERCEFSRLGGWALDLSGKRMLEAYPRVGAHPRFVGGNMRVLVNHNLFHELGAGALQTIFDDRLTFTNNIVYRVGLIHQGAAAVLLHRAYNAKIEDNDFSDLPYVGVHLGYCWSEDDCQTGGNSIGRNHFSRVGKRTMSDFAAIYTLGLQGETTRIFENNIHEVSAYGEFGQPIGAGVYTDEGSNNLIVERNSIVNTSGAALFHHWGAGLLFKNNYLSNESTAAVKFVAAGTPKAAQPGRSSLTYEGNVSYAQNLAQPYGFSYLDTHPGKQGTLTRTSSLQNMFFNASGPIDLSQNQSRGLDKDGVVTDPLFEDPSRAPLKLKANSPALSKGIPSFDLTSAGVKQEAGWQQLAKKIHVTLRREVDALNTKQTMIEAPTTLGANEYGVTRKGNTIVEVSKPDEAAFSRTVAKLTHPVSRVGFSLTGSTPDAACFVVNLVFSDDSGQLLANKYQKVTVSAKFELESSVVVPYGTKSIAAGIRFLDPNCARKVKVSPVTLDVVKLFDEDYQESAEALMQR
jgi:Right handed beta helix region